MSYRTKQASAVAAILGLACAAALILYWLRPPPERVELQRPPMLVDVAIVEPQSQQLWLHSQGSVAATTHTRLMTEVAGKVVAVSPAFEAGTLVDKDDMLLQIDPRDYQARVKRAEAAVAAARSNLSQERGRAAVAKKDMEDYPRKHVSDEARQLALRLPQVQDAAAQLDAAQADLDKALLDLERCTLRAPYRGIVKSRQADLGQYLSMAAPVGDLFAVDSAELRLPIAADNIQFLQPDTLGGSAAQQASVPVILQDEQGQRWQAAIARSERVLDERSRVLFLVARINDPYGLNAATPPLRIGTFVSARIQGRQVDNVVVLPRRILRTGNTLWLVTDDNTLREQAISIFKAEGDQLIITGGLEPGQRVVLAALPNAIAGTAVQIHSQTPSTVLAATQQTPDEAEGQR